MKRLRAVRPWVALLAVVGVVLALATTTAARATGASWSSTWNSAQDHAQPVGPWSAMTLRMVEHVSLPGTQLRLHLSNWGATSTAVFSRVTVGVQLNAQTTTAAPVTATFAGSQQVTLAPGVTILSDPVPLPTTAGERLLVSLAIPATVSIASAPMHTYADETEYVGAGDVSGLATFNVNNTFGFTSYLDGLDVDTPGPATVVAVGDSITDLAGSPPDTDTRWPDYLARRVAPLGLAVTDQGISGNWVTQDQGASGGPSLTDRWQRDILDEPGVKDVIDADGINDLRGGVTAGALEVAQASLVASAHSNSLRIWLATLTPCAGASNCGTAVQAQIQAYNGWLLGGSSGSDGVVDFASAVGSGTSLNPMYDDGDHLHWNSAGCLMAAQSINVGAL